MRSIKKLVASDMTLATNWRGRRDLNPRAGFSQPTPLAGEPLRPLGYFRRSMVFYEKWRREWDSNPRRLAPRRFSRPVPSTARTSLQILLHLRTPQYDIISQGNLSTKNSGKARKVFLKKLKKTLAKEREACYI